MEKIGEQFFNRPCVEVAKDLLGALLVRRHDGEAAEEMVVRIVDTEAYVGFEDKACHSYGGKVTKRNKAMYMEPGTAYVYNIYGIYQCINISTMEQGSAVLLRAAQPIEGVEHMQANRLSRSKGHRLERFKLNQLCNGPSKLCQALDIRRDNFDQVNLCQSDHLYFAFVQSPRPPCDLLQTKRIGIAYAEEWSEKLLRFCIANNRFVSGYKVARW